MSNRRRLAGERVITLSDHRRKLDLVTAVAAEIAGVSQVELIARVAARIDELSAEASKRLAGDEQPA